MNMRRAEADVTVRATEAPRRTGREAWLDIARAIALVLVVTGHAERGLVAAGILSPSAAQDPDLVVYSFHVPLFFLISGLLFQRSIQRRPFMRTWKERTIRLVQPCLIWSLVLLALLVLAANRANAPLSLANALASIVLLPIQPVSIFWFLYTLLLCMAVSGLALEYGRMTRTRLLLGSAILHLGYLLFLTDSQSGAGLAVVRFAEHQLYFALGIFLSPSLLANGTGAPLQGLSGAASGRRAAMLTALLASCFAVAAGMLVIFELSYHSAVGTLAALSGSGAVLSACYLAAEIKRWSAPASVMTISKQTLPIFCMHVPFVSATRIALSEMGTNDPTLHLIAGMLLGVGGPLVALKVMDHLGVASLAGFVSERRALHLAGRV